MGIFDLPVFPFQSSYLNLLPAIASEEFLPRLAHSHLYIRDIFCYFQFMPTYQSTICEIPSCICDALSQSYLGCTSPNRCGKYLRFRKKAGDF